MERSPKTKKSSTYYSSNAPQQSNSISRAENDTKVDDTELQQVTDEEDSCEDIRQNGGIHNTEQEMPTLQVPTVPMSTEVVNQTDQPSFKTKHAAEIMRILGNSEELKQFDELRCRLKGAKKVAKGEQMQ